MSITNIFEIPVMDYTYSKNSLSRLRSITHLWTLKLDADNECATDTSNLQASWSSQGPVLSCIIWSSNQEFGNDRIIPFKFGVRYGDRVPAEGGG